MSIRPIKYYAGIGSRETPEEILALMRRVAAVLYRMGWTLRSGGADGADHAFYAGATQDPSFDPDRVKIYLAWNGMKGHGGVRLYEDPSRGFYNATLYSTHEEAKRIAQDLHGAWEKLGNGGQLLHTRNVFQILGEDLNSQVRMVICYAKPVGNQGAVKGGTNTAVKLALLKGADVINLATEGGLARINAFLEKYEQAA